MENLWPDDLVKIEIKSPVTILKEQAIFLCNKTNNIIEGYVKRVESELLPPSIFIYSFNIRVPVLGNYIY